ncbi:MAG: hypothetical protein ACREBG_23275 [Pyrinomonadaceae bacterium]
MKKRILSSGLLTALLVPAIACMQAPTTSQTETTNATTTNAALPAELKPGLDSITSDAILQRTKVLSSDEYEGRGPGTKGEELSSNT